VLTLLFLGRHFCKLLIGSEGFAELYGVYVDDLSQWLCFSLVWSRVDRTPCKADSVVNTVIRWSESDMYIINNLEPVTCSDG
jgi:hypothetical protein